MIISNKHFQILNYIYPKKQGGECLKKKMPVYLNMYYIWATKECDTLHSRQIYLKPTIISNNTHMSY
jgi:hypothetical protein